jgi:hypothetical protein
LSHCTVIIHMVVYFMTDTSSLRLVADRILIYKFTISVCVVGFNGKEVITILYFEFNIGTIIKYHWCYCYENFA